jgi:ornithine cyclodeaminase
VARLIDSETLIAALRQGFIDYSAKKSARAQRVRSDLPGPGTATVLFPGIVPNAAAYTVKVHAKFPAETPAIRGVLCLHDAQDGRLLAVMDSTYLTALRTGLTGALAAHVLSRPDADIVAVIGAGVQGTFQLDALAHMRPLREVKVYDVDRNRAAAYAREMSERLRVAVEAADSIAAGVADADIVLTATWARTPFIKAGMLAAGTHVTTLGADEPGKAEIDADVITSSLFVCDDRDLAIEVGALAGVGLGKEVAAAELGEVLAGMHPGRTDPAQTTIFGGVGLAFQDAIAAWSAYEAAKEEGVGSEFDFLE